MDETADRWDRMCCPNCGACNLAEEWVTDPAGDGVCGAAHPTMFCGACGFRWRDGRVSQETIDKFKASVK